jgi:hypothetical protein
MWAVRRVADAIGECAAEREHRRVVRRMVDTSRPTNSCSGRAKKARILQEKSRMRAFLSRR